MTNQNTAVATVAKEDRTMEYVPFGSEDKIKLSVKIIQDIVCIPTRTGKVCDEREAMKFMMLCKARALNPFEGDGFLMGYEGRDGISWSLITAHQAFLKRAEPHPEFAGMRSGVVLAEFAKCPACDGAGQLKSNKPCRRCNEMGVSDEVEGDILPKGATLHGGWATIFFKNRPEPMHKRVALAVFKKPFGRWNDDPAGMIVKCAEADALRSSFPTKLGGLYLKEEVESTQPTQSMTTEGMFGRQVAPIVEVEPAPEPSKPTRTRRATTVEVSPATQTQEPKSEAPPQSPAPAQILVNEKTKLAEWMTANQFGWATLQPIVAEFVGAWAQEIGSFEELSVPQCKAILAAKAGLEAELAK